MSVILDASALLALIFGEPGAEIVIPFARGSQILSVNFTEVVGRVQAIEGNTKRLVAAVDSLEIHVRPFDRVLAQMAGELRAHTDQIGASLADRACLAFAILHRQPVLTADKDWSKLELDIDIRQIR